MSSPSVEHGIGYVVGSDHHIVCSCGVVGCPELGWPHEWDPVACGDTCVLSGQGNPHVFTVGGVTLPTSHPVAAPYVRVGSGYACAGCVEEQ